VRPLTGVLAGQAAIAPNAAVALVFAGVGLWLVVPDPRRPHPGRLNARWLGRAIGAGLAVFGAVVLAEDLTAFDPGIDRILFPDLLEAWHQVVTPGRLSSHAGIAFLVVGLAMALLDVDADRGFRPARVLGPLGALIAVVALLANMYGLTDPTGRSEPAGMPPPTAAAFVLLTIGLLACRPERPAMRAFVSPDLGGVTVRRLAPAVLTLLVLLAVLFSVIRATDWPLDGLGVTAAMTVLVVTVYLALRHAGTVLDRAGRRHHDLAAALREHHDFSETVLNSLHDGLVAFGADGVVLQVTPRWCEITGFAAEDAVGCRPPYPWCPPELVEQTAAALAATPGTSSPAEFDTYLLRPDGTRKHVRATVTPIRDARGALRMTIVNMRDLTERNRVEAERRHMAEQLDHLFDMSHDLMSIAGTDGYLKRLNPAWERTLGRSADELMSRPYLDLIHPDEVAATREQADALRERRVTTLAFEGRMRCADGTYRWISWNGTLAPDDDIIYAVGRDVTEQRAAHEARARLAAIVDSTDEAIIGQDLDGTITSWNTAAERIYGYPAAEAMGRSVRMLFRPDDTAEADEILAAVARGEGVREHDGVRVRKDGTEIRVGLSISSVRGAGGAVIGAASVDRDITDRKQVQEMLAAARDEAVAAAQLRSQFVAMVSHEIRTPMNGVIGLTTLLLETALDRAQRRYADAIQVSARALLTIINDILDFSKIEAGKVTLVEADFDLGALVEEVVNVAAEASRDKDLEVVGSYAAGLPVAVSGDEGRLRQVLLNLIGNAVKFTERGEVVLRVDAEPAPPGEVRRYTFGVTDTGIGIAPADVSRLFEAFTQADAATSRQFGGTGLGLTICRQLVELMGGRLEVDSRPGQGSRFAFTVALASQPEPEFEPARGTPAPDRLSGRRLLVVDDNATSRELLAEHARSWGMTAVTAADAPTALARLADATPSGTPYEIVVVDQHMPGMGGVDLAERIIADGDIPTPVMVLLTSGSHQDVRLGAVAGSIEVLPKPVGPSALYNCLVQLLDPGTAGTAELAGTVREARGPGADDRSTGERGLILLAEDNDINQMVAVDTLAMLGYRADLARNGIEAVRLAQTRLYHAILMDCQMPKMDGFEATRELRRQEGPDRHVPIIALTAGALTEDRQRCLDAGMDDYLAKPIDPDDLRAALERWTGEDAPRARSATPP
jgi:PAS domain S-box-containing protein